MRRIALSTGIELDVDLRGPEGEPALIFLHGFPESHRTWRHQTAAFAADHFVVAPDQRGFAGSSKPTEVEDYGVDHVIADLLALADALGIGRFTLVGHDWGGVAAWSAALKHPDRIARLAILNAPHPVIFQRTLLDDPAQRAASQYITALRDPGMEARIEAIGRHGFFETMLSPLIDRSKVTDADIAAYLDEWRHPGAITGMLNWYRASGMVVPAPGAPAPKLEWLDAAFPKIKPPTLVVWGTRDGALLPVQLQGLPALVDDLTIVRLDAGHFVTWEAADAVNAVLRDFLAQHPID